MRKGDIPNRAGAERLLLDKGFLNERAIGVEHLDAIIHAIANIQKIVVREHGAVDGIAELLRGRAAWIVGTEVCIAGLIAVSSPVALVFAGLGIEDDDAVIAVAIGDIELIGLRIDESLRGQPDIIDVVAAFAVTGLADLQQEFSVLRELEDLVVSEAIHLVAGLGLFILAIDCAATALGSTAVATQPHVAFVVDRDAVRRLRPIVACSGAAPMSDEVAFLIEFENRRRGRAALRDLRIGGGVLFTGFERPNAMNDPDVILGVGRDADGLAENPMIRERLRPVGVDFETRRAMTAAA